MVFHGVPRLTMDVDLMLSFDTANLNRFLQAALALNLKPVMPVALLDLADPAKVREWIAEKNLIAFALQAPAVGAPTLDILVQPRVNFDAAYERRVEKDFGNLAISIASIDDMITLKAAAGRLQDEADLISLRRLSENNKL